MARRNPTQKERGQGTPLKAAALRTLGPGRYSDGPFGHGLMFNVKPTGARSWLQRMTVDGRRRTIGIGPFPVVSLAEARSAAFENARKRQQGINPIVERQRTRAMPTFSEAMEATIALQRATWKPGSRNEPNWRSSLAHAKAIAGRPVDKVTADDVIAILAGMGDKAATARALRQRLRTIFEWARSKGHRADNPADERIDAALPKAGRKVEHRKAVPYQDVPAMVRDIRAIEAPTWHGMKLAAEFLILTGMRSGEVLGARWSEIDLDSRTWTIPEGRMKGNREHRVPLSDAAVSALLKARERHSSGLVFRSPRGGQIDRLIPVLRKAGCDADVHGFRSSLRDWCSETGVDDTVAERCIAHYEADKTRRAYHRTDRFEDRVSVMERWARHCTGTAA